MLNTIATNVPTMSKPLLAPLNIDDTYSLSSTNNNPLQATTNINAPASQCQTLYQPNTAPDKGNSLFLISPSLTVNPANPSSAFTQNYTVPFVSMNKLRRIFDVPDHQYSHEEYLHQVDAHMIFTMREQPVDLVACNQWH